MYMEAQLNPPFLAKHHGNRQADMTASRPPPSRRENPHENLRSPLGSCNARTQLPRQKQAQCAERIRSKKICDAVGRPRGAPRARRPATPLGRGDGAAKGRRPPRGAPVPVARRRAQRRSWGRDLPKARKGPQGAVPPRAFSALAARGAPRARPGRGGRQPARRGPASDRRYRKAPSASATPCPPAAWRCSTLGEGGLNCRVRDGTG